MTMHAEAILSGASLHVLEELVRTAIVVSVRSEMFLGLSSQLECVQMKSKLCGFQTIWYNVGYATQHARGTIIALGNSGRILEAAALWVISRDAMQPLNSVLHVKS